MANSSISIRWATGVGVSILFVRRHGGWQEPYGVQPALLPAALRQQQMPVVNRIKSSAEYAESHDAGNRMFSHRVHAVSVFNQGLMAMVRKTASVCVLRISSPHNPSTSFMPYSPGFLPTRNLAAARAPAA